MGQLQSAPVSVCVMLPVSDPQIPQFGACLVLLAQTHLTSLEAAREAVSPKERIKNNKRLSMMIPLQYTFSLPYKKTGNQGLKIRKFRSCKKMHMKMKYSLAQH